METKQKRKKSVEDRCKLNRCIKEKNHLSWYYYVNTETDGLVFILSCVIFTNNHSSL